MEHLELLDLAERDSVASARDRTAPDTVELSATRLWLQLGAHWQKQRLEIPAPRLVQQRPMPLLQALLCQVCCLPHQLIRQVGAVECQEWQGWRN